MGLVVVGIVTPVFSISCILLVTTKIKKISRKISERRSQKTSEESQDNSTDNEMDSNRDIVVENERDC